MNLKLNKDIIFFDLETSGVDVTTARIVQIAIIKYKTDGTVEEKQYLINPEMSIPKEASDVHGITDDMVKDKPTFKKYAKNLRKYIEGCDLGGFNSNKFDVNILNAELVRAGEEPINWNPNLLDVFLLYKEKYSSKLVDIYKRFFNEDLENAHDAMSDNLATVRVLNQILENFDMEDMTVGEIDALLQGDKKRVDFAGALYEKDGEVFWAIGKHKDSMVRTTSDAGYISWFCANFPKQSSEIVLKLIGEEKLKSKK